MASAKAVKKTAKKPAAKAVKKAAKKPAAKTAKKAASKAAGKSNAKWAKVEPFSYERKIGGKKIIVFSIFMTHVKRIGFLRTFFGGFLMYLSFLEFVFIQLTTIVVLYQWMLRPFFNLKKFAMKKYILIDRTRIAGMALFDRINCDFCGYANGNAKLWNDQLDEIAGANIGKGKFFQKGIVLVYVFFLTIISCINYVFSKLLFLVIALFLGMHWSSNKEARERLRKTNYAGGYGFFIRGLIRFAKLYAGTLATNLEQIESSWCPLKHEESKNGVASEHHKNFYAQKDIASVMKVLATEGTVSPRKPKY